MALRWLFGLGVPFLVLLALEAGAAGSKAQPFHDPLNAGCCASPAKFPHDADPTFSPDGRQLAFVRWFGPDDPERLMLARADGTGAHQVGAGFGPDWSPDGRSIAFTAANRDLRVLDLASREVRTLVRGIWGSPSWSPDGRKLAFSDSAPNAGTRLGTVTADGPEVRYVPVEGLLEFSSFHSIDWSPDGKQFVFSLELEPNTTGDLYTLSVVGGRPRKLTHDLSAVDPNWSPDGRWIAYASDGEIFSGGDSSVKLIRPDGTGQHRLPPPETAFGWSSRDPAWKDARTIVYSAWRPDHALPYVRNIELHTIGIDRTGERRLTYHRQFGRKTRDVWQTDSWLTGTYLDDIMYPRGGDDRVRAGRGRDVIYARGGGRDTVDCGSGKDVVFADRSDLIRRSCERVQRK